MEKKFEFICSSLEKLRNERPLIHHITNWVTIYDCANITRAIGALPVMAHAPEEVRDMAGISSALVLNIGTLTSETIEAMISAAKKANEKGIPVVLDAVGAGATDFRTQKSVEILENVKVNVIKGNAGEIATLAGANAEVRGVESGKVKGNILEIARKLSSEYGNTVAVTGKEDFVAGGEAGYVIKNGHELMGKFVGSGCMAASLIGCFAAVETDYEKAASSALVCFGIAGELAASAGAGGPASYKETLYDELYSLNTDKIRKMAKIERIDF